MYTASIRLAIIETWAQAWSESDETRRIELLRQAAAPDCAYTDPNVELAGHTAISTCMAGFQESAPGASAGTFDAQGRLTRMVGFPRWSPQSVPAIKAGSFSIRSTTTF